MILEEMKSAGISWESVAGLVQDRVIWRNLIEASCAHNGVPGCEC